MITHTNSPPLLPKLRGLLPSSLTKVIPLPFAFSARLPVSVSRTGSKSIFTTRGFSRQCDCLPLALRPPHHDSSSTSGFPYRLLRHRRLEDSQPYLGSFTSCVPPCSSSFTGTGFFTRFPSATPFGFTLGPDLPWADDPSPGTLRL